MMKMDADMVVMTLPDLQKYHIKRSMVRDDIEYIYIDHGIGSLNLMLRKHAIDAFDTIFVSNEKVVREIREQEKVYQLPEKTLLPWGSSLIDDMILAYEKDKEVVNNPKCILIAPSWQKDNILDCCIDKILDGLLGKGYDVVVRAHPQYVRHFSDKLDELEEHYKQYKDFTLQREFSSNDNVFKADILITDWSGIAYEYSFATLKSTLLINTTMKVMNPDYEEIDVVPFDIEIRNRIGIALELNELDKIADTAKSLLFDEMYSKEEIAKIREQYLYNVGNSGRIGADYIIKKLIEYS